MSTANSVSNTTFRSESEINLSSDEGNLRELVANRPTFKEWLKEIDTDIENKRMDTKRGRGWDELVD